MADEEGVIDLGEGGAVTESETTGYFSQLGDSFGGICVGLLLFFGAFPLLWWNEGRAVDTYKAINEGRKIVVPIDPSTYNSVNDGKLVYANGLVEPTENITDDAFGFGVFGKTQLQRAVEMYQWVETSKTTKNKNIGGSTTKTTEYSYSKQWKTEVVSSTNFKNEIYRNKNPTVMPYQSLTLYSTVVMGSFVIPDDMVSQVSTEASLDTYPTISNNTAMSSNLLYQQSTSTSDYPSGFYFGADSMTPAVGDTKVTYTVFDAGEASIIAEQSGFTFDTYIAKSGSQLYRIEKGKVSADEMFDNAKAENKSITMIVRIVGAIVMSVGIGLMLNPIAELVDVIPCLGDCVQGAIFIVAGIIGCTISLVVIGIAWVAQRPVILGVSAVGLAIVGFLVYRAVQKKKEKGMAPKQLDEEEEE